MMPDRPELIYLNSDETTARLVDCECNDPTGHEHSPCGMRWFHLAPDGSECGASGGYVPFGNPPYGWKLESVDPLTISPSLLCTRCQRHGFIRGGRWVPA